MSRNNLLAYFVLMTVISLIFGAAMRPGTHSFDEAYAQNSTESNNTSTSLQSLTGVPYPNIPHENGDAIASFIHYQKIIVIKN